MRINLINIRFGFIVMRFSRHTIFIFSLNLRKSNSNFPFFMIFLFGFITSTWWTTYTFSTWLNWQSKSSINCITPCVLFIMIYSILPYKELRFPIYTVPTLNMSIVQACSSLFIYNLRFF